MKKLFAIGIITLFLVLAVFQNSASAQETANNEFILPTSEGSSVRINLFLENSGENQGLPILKFNQSYTLKVKLKLEQLGTNTRDIHDIHIFTSIHSSNLLVQNSYYSGVYQDLSTSFTTGQEEEYDLSILPIGKFHNSTGVTGTLEIQMSVKEDVKFSVDPETVFPKVTFNIFLDNSSPSVPVKNVEPVGNLVKRSTVMYSLEESQINFTTTIASKAAENSSSLYLDLNKAYSLSVYLKVLSLGANVRAVHSPRIKITVEDASLTDFLPTESTKTYYAATFDFNTRLQADESFSFDTVIYMASNINTSSPTLNFVAEVSEDVEFNIDPVSKIGDFKIRINLNQPTSSQSSVILFFIPVFAILAIPIIRRKLKQKI